MIIIIIAEGASTDMVANPAHRCLNRRMEFPCWPLFAREAVPSRVSRLISLTRGKSGVCIVHAHLKKKWVREKRDAHQFEKSKSSHSIYLSMLRAPNLVPADSGQAVNAIATQMRDPL